VANKNLPTIRQSTEVALSRANTLMDVADKILTKQSTDLAVDESWMERFLEWADDNVLYGGTLPKDKDNLVNLTKLYLAGSQLTELPKEIGNLVNLRVLHLYKNQLTALPKEIGNLANLIKLGLADNQLTELPKEIGNLVNLTYIGLSDKNLTEMSMPKELLEWFYNIVNRTKPHRF